MIWLLLVLFLTIVVLSYVVYQLSTRVLQFDDLFEVIQFDIEENIEFLQKTFLEHDVLNNSEEVLQFHRRLLITRERMIHYVEQLRAVTSKKRTRETHQRPVVQ